MQKAQVELTRQEHQILQMRAYGFSRLDIAVHFSRKELEEIEESIISKLDVSDMKSAITKAMRNSWIY